MREAETILQLGAGRFLRGFVDRFVDQARKSGQPLGRVVVVQSTAGSRADSINGQPDGFHVLVRGCQDEQVVERLEKVESISRGLLAENDWSEVLRIGATPDLEIIVSNATEAGYKLEPGDQLAAAPEKSLPAKSLPGKLVQILWGRFQAGGKGLTLLPCELIERNAEKLLALVLDQARLWELPEAFLDWVAKECQWLCNLVDCIVTNAPSDHPLAGQDRLMVCAEPYALWAIEKPAGNAQGNDLRRMLYHPAIEWVDQLAPYYLRKVRMLNGLHSAMVGKFLPQGFETVQQVMGDKVAYRWVRDLMFEEIVPTLAYRLHGGAAFADATIDRLRNPFQAHKLSDIALNHADKIKVRLIPTQVEYRQLFQSEPQRINEALKGSP